LCETTAIIAHVPTTLGSIDRQPNPSHETSAMVRLWAIAVIETDIDTCPSFTFGVVAATPTHPSPATMAPTYRIGGQYRTAFETHPQDPNRVFQITCDVAHAGHRMNVLMSARTFNEKTANTLFGIDHDSPSMKMINNRCWSERKSATEYRWVVMQHIDVSDTFGGWMTGTRKEITGTAAYLST
jgi:hypothetical protein